MSRSGFWLVCFFSFLISLIIGAAGYIVIFSRWPSLGLRDFTRISKDYKPITAENVRSTNSHASKPSIQPVTAKRIILNNPFISPLQYKTGQRPVRKRQRSFLEFQGIVETENAILGIVKIASTGDTFVVREGEDLVLFGLVIGTITPDTLTYYKDGIKAVISLGGVRH